MSLGQFSLSLSVKDISASKAFYETLGFEAIQGCGSVEAKWLMLKSGNTMIGLFEGMLQDNILTFNPDNVREVQTRLQEQGVAIDKQAQGEEGPAHMIVKDPDNNVIMLEQI